MLHMQGTQDVRPAQHVIDELLARGASAEEIEWAIAHQNAQRRAGAPVLPLAVQLNMEPLNRDQRSPLGRITSKLLGTKPPARKSTGGTHRTGNPVWAGSVKTGGDEEREFVRPMSQDQFRTMRRVCYLVLEKARELARASRAGAELTRDERRLLAFTNSCHEILLRMLDEINYRKGWCVPAYETIMHWTKLARGTVYKALKALQALGLLDWTRRFNYTHSREYGARSEQTSNLYRASLPEWLAKLIGIHAPAPDDALARQDAALEDHALMLASASKAERRRLMPADPATRAALIAAAARADRRAALGDTREFTEWLPPHHISIFNKRDDKELPLSGNTLALTGH